jgi:hypothetical protein
MPFVIPRREAADIRTKRLGSFSGVLTRWASTGLSEISVLRVKVRMQEVMLSCYAAQEFEKAEKSITANAKSV